MDRISPLWGIGINNGIAIGRALVLRPIVYAREQTHCEDVEAEILRLKTAIASCAGDIESEVDAAQSEHKEILKSHLNFLEDHAFNDKAFARIRETARTADSVISEITDETYQSFIELDIPYLKERADDVRDVGSRIIRKLTNAKTVDLTSLPHGTILFAQELVPSQTAKLDKERVAGFVTERGGKTSHTAIMAKTLGIVAVVGCVDALEDVNDGDEVIVDGSEGQVIIRPDEESLSRCRERQADSIARKEALNALRHKHVYRCPGENEPGQHVQGQHVPVLANVGCLKDIELALECGADGVGLFRTEFLFMDRPDLPGEDEQYEVYKAAAEMLGRKPLVIRTLDIGGDKSLPGLSTPEEENPFLGLRAIRLCLDKPDIFKTQLRAILRAMPFGNISVMFPMISALHELRSAKAVFMECAEELGLKDACEGGGIRLGMMIEIPAAALQAAAFALEADFFSIGTNDLTQYTLAVDRGNDSVQYLYDYMHPAVLQLVATTISAAKKEGIDCCMCGEMAADPYAIPLLAQMGLGSFSVSAGEVPPTKHALVSMDGFHAKDS